eukprot:COSAG02_NODE_1972_length_10217_cov_140.461653_14_plen_93_part_00
MAASASPIQQSNSHVSISEQSDFRVNATSDAIGSSAEPVRISAYLARAAAHAERLPPRTRPPEPATTTQLYTHDGSRAMQRWWSGPRTWLGS